MRILGSWTSPHEMFLTGPSVDYLFATEDCRGLREDVHPTCEREIPRPSSAVSTKKVGRGEETVKTTGCEENTKAGITCANTPPRQKGTKAIEKNRCRTETEAIQQKKHNISIRKEQEVVAEGGQGSDHWGVPLLPPSTNSGHPTCAGGKRKTGSVGQGPPKKA